jgi:hypothetical protein
LLPDRFSLLPIVVSVGLPRIIWIALIIARKPPGRLGYLEIGSSGAFSPI